MMLSEESKRVQREEVLDDDALVPASHGSV